MRRRDVRRPSRAYLNTSTQYHRCVCVRSDVPDAGTWPGAFGTGCPSSPGCRWETTDSLKFLGDPLVLLPCSSTPAGLETSGPYDVPSMAPAVSTTKAPTITADFGAGSHGFGTRCLRLARRGCAPADARLAAAVGQTLRRGTYTHRTPFERFPLCSVHRFLLSQAYLDAITLPPGGDHVSP
jgi:hypothetical protein